MVLSFKKRYFECIFLILFIGMFLWAGCANLFDHKLSHDFPYGYFASDAFLHQTTAQSIKNMDNYVNVIYYKAAGYEDIVGYDPPFSGFLSTNLSYLSGLEVYDTIYLLVFVNLVFTILIIYILAKKINKNIAILSLPFTLLLFAYTFYSGIIYGQWDFYYGTTFLVAAIWALSNFKLDKTYLLLGFFAGVAFLAHAVEGIWAAGFVILWLIIKSLMKKISFSEIKKILISGIIAFLTSSYFLLIFMKIWLPGRQGRLFKFTTALHGGYPIASIFEINWILIVLLLVGILFFIFVIKDKKNLLPWLGLYILAIVYTNYIGFDKAFQTRFNLPIYLAIFFGTALYISIKLSKVKWKVLFSFAVAIVLSLSFIGIVYQEMNAPGMMNQYYWDGLEWINEETPEKADVFYFYHTYLSSRNAFENGERVTNTIDLDDYIEAMNDGELRREYNKITGRGKMFYKESFLNWIDRNTFEDENFEGLTDICNYEYYSFEVYDSGGSISPIIQYNLALREALLNHEGIEEVFNNGVISILINNNPGEECVA